MSAEVSPEEQDADVDQALDDLRLSIESLERKVELAIEKKRRESATN